MSLRVFLHSRCLATKFRVCQMPVRNILIERSSAHVHLACVIHSKLMWKFSQQDNFKFQDFLDTFGTSVHPEKALSPKLAARIKKLQQYNHTSFQRERQELKQAETLFCENVSSLGLSNCLNLADKFLSYKFHSVAFLRALFQYAEQLEFNYLPPSYVCRLMFYTFLQRSAPVVLHHKVETYMLQNLDKFDLFDLGIICLGFFTTSSRVNSPELLDRISKRLLCEFENADIYMLINILKVLRHSVFSKISFYENLASRILESDYIQKLTNLNHLMQISHLYASCSVYHKELTQALLTRFVNLMDEYQVKPLERGNVRSKDISKFVWALGYFDHEPECQKQSYLGLVSGYRNAGRTQDDIYPESLAEMLQGLIYLQIHPSDLIDKLLYSDVAAKLEDGEKSKANQVLLCHNSIILECPDYWGNLLSQFQVKRLIKRIGKNIGFELTYRVGLKEVAESLKDLLGEDRVRLHYILPHFNMPDIELRFDAEDQPVPVPAENVGQLLHASRRNFSISRNKISELSDVKPQGKKVAVLVLGKNQYFSNVDEITGHMKTKLRHLRILGYEPVLINPAEASKFRLHLDEEKRQFLCEKIHEGTGIELNFDSLRTRSV